MKIKGQILAIRLFSLMAKIKIYPFIKKNMEGYSSKLHTKIKTYPTSHVFFPDPKHTQTHSNTHTHINFLSLLLWQPPPIAAPPPLSPATTNTHRHRNTHTQTQSQFLNQSRRAPMNHQQ